MDCGRRGLSVEDPGRGGVIDFAGCAPPRFRRPIIGRQEPAALIRVFRPVKGRSAVRPTLRRRRAGRSDAADNLDDRPGAADATGTIRWAGKDAPEMLEFVLPGVRVQEVRGADVANWSRSGSRVQVWFRRSIREGEPSGPGPWP